MTPKKKTSDKVPAGTSDAVDSGSTSNITDNTEPSEQSASANLDPKELALGDQLQEMLNTINKHMDEVASIHNMSHQAAQLLSDIKPVLSIVWAELSAKTAILEQLYADQAPADRLNQVATAARNTYQQLLIPSSKTPRIIEIQDNPHKSVQYTPFNDIEDNDTDSETTIRNHREGSVPFQHIDDRDILDMPNNESDNALVQMFKYMLNQNSNMTMEKTPLAKAGVKVTPPDKYSREQSFKALKTFVKGLL
ncbi:hypothetical protein M422DRAFT_249446 [Sphaerobolus stellatus SS14]|uniref:Uncharacterized protein n=1 Tax=Sphaerobolus stellatus (strain SS14) TaxID=990650 RepID=A0A0C9VVN3_SPHS4|nr:hypothetical protein M422DRAFT_249446 [Sphaerobolus stellatus SS14]